jgi:hypothetical protein
MVRPERFELPTYWRVAPIPVYFQTTNEGAPGPSRSGTGDTTDFNPESVRNIPGQSP